MKNNCLLSLMGLLVALCLVGGCSGGGKEDIPTPPPVVEKDYLNVTNDSIQTKSQGGDVTVSFTTNRSWTASSSQSWCKLSSTSGDKGTVSLKVTVDENTMYSERISIVTLKAGSCSETITITQQAAEEPDELEVATTTFHVGVEGGGLDISFTTNKPWTASSDQSWCKLSSTSGDKGTISFQAILDSNNTYSERTATLIIKVGKATQKITVIQEAAEPDVLDVATTSFPVKAGGGDVTVSFTTNRSWTASSSQSWCKLSAAQGEKGSHTLTVTIEPSTSWSDRTAIITLKAGSAQETITITQERHFQLTVTYDGALVDYAGATVSVEVLCNTQYEVSCQASWVKQVKAPTTGGEAVQFQVEANESENAREAEVIIYNEDKNLRKSIVIKQEGKPEDTSVKPGGNLGNMGWG